MFVIRMAYYTQCTATKYILKYKNNSVIDHCVGGCSLCFSGYTMCVLRPHI